METYKQNTFWETTWGFFATLGIGALIFIAFGIAQSIAVIIYGFYLSDWDSSTNIEGIMKSLAFNGDAISIAEVPSAIFGLSLIILFTSMRKPKSILSYLEFRTMPTKSLLKWLGVMVLMLVLMQVSSFLLERETPDFMTKVYASSTNLPMLWFAVIIAAPFFEEFLFRGYLFEGIRQTPVGNLGAILITSLTWAIIHIQYELFEITSIFLIGIVFAIAKLKTQSLMIPIAMHMMMNLAASVFMEIS